MMMMPTGVTVMKQRIIRALFISIGIVDIQEASEYVPSRRPQPIGVLYLRELCNKMMASQDESAFDIAVRHVSSIEAMDDIISSPSRRLQESSLVDASISFRILKEPPPGGYKRQAPYFRPCRSESATSITTMWMSTTISMHHCSSGH